MDLSTGRGGKKVIEIHHGHGEGSWAGGPARDGWCGDGGWPGDDDDSEKRWVCACVRACVCVRVSMDNGRRKV